MKRKLILVAVTVACLVGLGMFFHSPPSVMDVVTGASPKAKKAEQDAAVLEGGYVFCISKQNVPDSAVRELLRSSAAGEAVEFSEPVSIRLYVVQNDYALVRYAEGLCDRLNDAGADAELKQYSSTMLISRAMSGKYEAFIASDELFDVSALEYADCIALDSAEMG